MNPESLEEALAKRNSMSHVWQLLNPKEQYRDLYVAFMREWNRRGLQQQRQFYWFVREKRKRGEVVHDNPLYALTYIRPHPTNWNGKHGLNDLMKQGTKMVSARYGDGYGIYTAFEARLFEMKEIRALN